MNPENDEKTTAQTKKLGFWFSFSASESIVVDFPVGLSDTDIDFEEVAALQAQVHAGANPSKRHNAVTDGDTSRRPMGKMFLISSGSDKPTLRTTKRNILSANK
mmetsp:Transcript_22309/g.45172  ORF Transcript_22309/g.45172 Transcript_22309/m.45172 type:complete len:104 (+) Transcript_22309:601-912(+)